MTVARSTYTTSLSSSSGPRLPGEASKSSILDETSPLLQPERVGSLSERWHSTASAFLDRNAGLLLIAASQFFFSASNVSVKWLNSLDEPLPMLEVRDTPIIIFDALG